MIAVPTICDAVLFDIGRVLATDTVGAQMRVLITRYGADEPALDDYHQRFRPDLDRGMITEDAFWQRLPAEADVAAGVKIDLQSLITPVPGTRRVLDRVVAAGLTTAILSNDSSMLGRMKLDQLDLTGCFQLSLSQLRWVWPNPIRRYSGSPRNG